jgi:predicted DNA-binding antitoxin AbrB/MazE fold protein
VEGVVMSTQAIAIYEEGVLWLLTPVSLPERARVRVQILTDEKADAELHRAEEALVATGLVKPLELPLELKTVSRARRAELARLYATGGPLSDVILTERDV